MTTRVTARGEFLCCIAALFILMFVIGVWTGRTTAPARVDYKTCVTNVNAAQAVPEVCEGLLSPSERAEMIERNKDRPQ